MTWYIKHPDFGIVSGCIVHKYSPIYIYPEEFEKYPEYVTYAMSASLGISCSVPYIGYRSLFLNTDFPELDL